MIGAMPTHRAILPRSTAGHGGGFRSESCGQDGPAKLPVTCIDVRIVTLRRKLARGTSFNVLVPADMTVIKAG